MKRELINTIKIDKANLEFIAKNNKINGSLLIEIERVMDEYAKKEVINKSETIIQECKNSIINFFKTEYELKFCTKKYYDRVKWYIETYGDKMFIQHDKSH